MRPGRMSLVSPGFPGGDANITRSTGWNTKSFPFPADTVPASASTGSGLGSGACCGAHFVGPAGGRGPGRQAVTNE
ncbi:hypothetical protein BJY54_002307 [Streptomyces nodosus]|nr:hypothetical protein [Streptomyces nodosus]